MRHVALALFLAGCVAGTPLTVQAPVTTTAASMEPTAPEPDAEEDFEKTVSEDDCPVPVSPRDPAWGSRGALVTIVEFADFQCPYCGRVEATLTQLKARYGKDDLRVVWKNMPLPFHPNAKPAAEAAMGVFDLAGNDAFWNFHDTLFNNQVSLGISLYERGARAERVNTTALREGLDNGRWTARVEADVALAQRLGISGTPNFLINGLQLTGAQPVEKFTSIIDAQLIAARDALTSGTSRSRIYTVMTKANRARAEDGEDH